MNTKPLVSVCIPSYNHEKYVKECINSIIAQTYKNIELIIVDDGSTDSTFSKIKELEEECQSRFVRFHYETKKNSGTCDTFNYLYSLANGDYVYIIASDDFAAPDAIDTLVNSFDSDDIVMVVGDSYIVDSDSKKISWDSNRNSVAYGTGYNTTFAFESRNREECITSFGEYKTLLHGNYLPNGQMVRRSSFVSIGGYKKEAPLEDWYMNLQLSKLGKLKFINIPLFYYRWHSTNTIKQYEKIVYLTYKSKFYEIKKVFEDGSEEQKFICDSNFDWNKEFSDLFTLVINHNMNLIEELRLCYKRIHTPSKRFLFLYVASYIPLVYSIIRYRRFRKHIGESKNFL